jgi:hypothetical protein
MSDEIFTMVLPPWSICPECRAVRHHNVSPWATNFPHKEGCGSRTVVLPNIASEEGVRLSAEAFKAFAREQA